MNPNRVITSAVKLGVFVCAVLAAGLVAQVASAQTVDVPGLQGGAGRYNPLDPTQANLVGQFQPSLLAVRNNTNGTDTAKSWLQFDLASLWTTYGQSNLLSATLTLVTQNGTSRSVDVSGIDDGAGLEGWSTNTLTWNNAPANITNAATAGWDLDWTKIYGGAPLWLIRGGGVLTNNTGAFANNAAYYSTNANLGAFLATDTDGLVTFIMSGPNGLNSNTRFWNVAGAWQTDIGHISPVLTLTFIPEPSTLALAILSLGLVAVGVRRRRS